MRNLGIELTNHFSGEVITIATCWKLTRQDGLVCGFTDHDKKLIIANVEYDSIAGFTPTNVESGSNLAVDNLDLSGQLYASKITKTDLLAGKYDFAEVEIFLVNYQQPGMGRLIQKRGVLGEVTLSKNLFHAEIRGLTQFLSQTMCDTYLPHCRANLGDHRCGFNLNQRNYRVDSRVSTVIDAQTFLAKELTQRSDWFAGGYVSWQSGSNKLLKMEVKEFGNGKVVLSLPMAFSINIGDRFHIFAGCDKSSKTCQEKFSNIINFRGEPDLPGMDKLINVRR